MLFINGGSHMLYPFHQVEGNVCRGQSLYTQREVLTNYFILFFTIIFQTTFTKGWNILASWMISFLVITSKFLQYQRFHSITQRWWNKEETSRLTNTAPSSAAKFYSCPCSSVDRVWTVVQKIKGMIPRSAKKIFRFI